MKILALEFSSVQRSVSVVTDTGAKPPSAADTAPAALVAGVLRTMFHGHTEVVETGGYGSNVIGMIDAALRQAELEREQVDCLAIGLGPGSYSGIRAVLAVAQGWQFAAGVRLIGISSADCIAARAHAENLTGPIAVVIDAQRNEFYRADYELDAGWRQVQPLRLVSPGDVSAYAAQGGVVVGPEITRWFPSGRVIFPSAAVLGALALPRTDFVSGDKLEPIYLRETTFVKAPPPRHYS